MFRFLACAAFICSLGTGAATAATSDWFIKQQNGGLTLSAKGSFSLAGHSHVSEVFSPPNEAIVVAPQNNISSTFFWLLAQDYLVYTFPKIVRPSKSFGNDTLLMSGSAKPVGPPVGFQINFSDGALSLPTTYTGSGGILDTRVFVPNTSLAKENLIAGLYKFEVGDNKITLRIQTINADGSVAPIPLPAAGWAMLSGVALLVGFARGKGMMRRKHA